MTYKRNDYPTGFRNGKRYGLLVGSISENKHTLETFVISEKTLGLSGVPLSVLRKVEKGISRGYQFVNSYYAEAKRILEDSEKVGVKIKPRIKNLDKGYKEYLDAHHQATYVLAWTIKHEAEKPKGIQK